MFKRTRCVIIVMLLTSVNVFCIDAIHKAAMVGDLELMKQLKEQGADINAKTNNDMTPIHIAAGLGNLEMMKWLKDQGADVNATDNVGDTPMHKSARLGHLEAMKWLKEQGLDINTKNNEGKAPIYFALLNNHEQVLQWLSDNGTDIYAVDNIIKFGSYYWRVLDVQDGNALILSEKVIEARQYHLQNAAVTWSECSLRKYLNTKFFETFSIKDKERILDTTVVNNNNPWYDTDGGEDTVDKIFLLSIEEVVKYFGDSGRLNNRQGQGHLIIDQYNQSRIAYDKNRRALLKNRRASWWWLRSPGGRTNYAASVNGNGDVYVNGYNIYAYYFGVRPALWLKIE